MATSEMTVKLGILMEDFAAGLNKAASHVRRFASDIKYIGKTLTQAITVPVAGVAFAAFKASEEATAIFKKFGERVKEIFGRLGDTISKSLNLEDVLNKIANVLDKAVNWFESLSEGTQKTIVQMVALVAILGPLLTIVSKLVSLGGILLKIIMAIGAFILSVKGAIVLLVVAIAALILKATGGWDKIVNWINGVTRGLTQQEIQARKTAKAWDDLKKSFKPSTAATEELIRLPLGPKQGDLTKAMVANNVPEFNRLSEWIAQTQRFGNAVNFLWSGLKTLGEATEKTLSKIRPLGGYGDLMAAGFRKAQMAIRDVFGDLFRRLDEMETKYKLEGGGFNMMEAARGSAIQTYTQLKSMGLPETDKRMVALKGRIEELGSAWNRFLGLMMETPTIAEQIAVSLRGMVESFIQGVGDAIARAIVYGESLSEAMLNVLKQLAATIISMLIQIGIQWVISKILHSVIMMTELVSGLKTYAALTYAAAFASTSAIPIVGPALAPAAAAAAVAAMLGGAAGSAALGAAAGAGMGAAGGAEGGIFTGTRPVVLAEVGKPEIALTQQNVDRFFGRRQAGGGDLHVHVEVDRRQIGYAVVKYGAEELKRQGI